MTRVVLGSASPGRRKVLRQAGIDPLVVISEIDEDAVAAALPPDASADDVVAALATAKAMDVAGHVPADVAVDCVVIGCDSMLYCDGELRGKPQSATAADLQWQTMGGRTGQLHTGHCLVRLQDGATLFCATETDVSTVHFSAPNTQDLQAYIASGEPLGVAGSFTIDGLGGWFIDGIDGAPSTVIGLSLPLVRTLLSAAGLPLSRLWAANPVAQ